MLAGIFKHGCLIKHWMSDYSISNLMKIIHKKMYSWSVFAFNKIYEIGYGIMITKGRLLDYEKESSCNL